MWSRFQNYKTPEPRFRALLAGGGAPSWLELKSLSEKPHTPGEAPQENTIIQVTLSSVVGSWRYMPWLWNKTTTKQLS